MASTETESAPPIENQADTHADSPGYKQLVKKLTVLAGLILLGAIAYHLFGDKLSLDYLAERESAFRAYQEAHPVLIYGVAFALYVVVTGLSLPGVLVLTLAYGWFFGFWPALILVSFSSVTGATVAFLVSRFLFRNAVQQRFGGRLKKFNRALETEGAFYLFTLRLIPVVPFFVINLVMGLTPLRTWTFWWISQVGMLPGTAVYVYAGNSVPSIGTLADEGARGILTPQLIAAFIVLGLFPITVKKIMGRIRSRSVNEAEEASNV